MPAFHCSKCQNPLQFPDQMVGRTIACPSCGTSQVIPAAGQAPPPMMHAAPPPAGISAAGARVAPPPPAPPRAAPPMAPSPRSGPPSPPRDGERPRRARDDDQVETVALGGGSVITAMPKPVFFALIGALGCLMAAMLMEVPYQILMPAVAEKPKETAPEPRLELTVQIDKIDESDGAVNRLFITSKSATEGLPDDVRKLADLVNTGRDLAKKVEISIEDAKGKRELTPKTLLTDDGARELFQPGKTVRVEVSPKEITKIKVAPSKGGTLKVDVMIVLDITGSMSGQIMGVRNGIQNFVETMRKQALDPMVGLTTFRDRKIGEECQLLTFRGEDFTNDPVEFRNQMAGVFANGGGDEPESGFDALDIASARRWRPDSSRVLLLITDAPPLIPDKDNRDEHDVAQKLKARDIAQLHLVVQARPERYERLQELLSREGKRGKVYRLADIAAGGRFDEILEVTTRTIVEEARRVAGDGGPPAAAVATVAGVATGREEVYEASQSGRILLADCIRIAILALGLALALIIGQRLYQGQSLFDFLAFAKGSLSIVAGVLAGLLGGGLVLLLTYSAEGGANRALVIICQMLGWTLLGSLIGLGMALIVPNLSYPKGLLGGCLGGVAGGIFFVLITMLLGPLLGRWLGALLLGFFVGLMVALIEAAFRRSWLEVRFGPRETRTVTLGSTPITIGSDERRATVVVPGAAPLAFRYFLDGDRVICEEKGGAVREMMPGERRQIGKVTITVCSPDTVEAVGIVLRLSDGREIPVSEGMPLTRDDLPGLASNSPDGTVAIVSPKPADPSILLLRNRSNRPWQVTERSGQTRTVEPGLGIPLEPGITIDFGRVRGQLIRKGGNRERRG